MVIWEYPRMIAATKAASCASEMVLVIPTPLGFT